MEILMSCLFTIAIISFGCSGMGFFNVLFEDSAEFEYNVIKNCKLDANKLRFLPRIIFKFFIFIIEYSYKFGIKSGNFLKFLFIK